MARQNKLLLNIDQQTTNEEKAQGRANLGLATVAATGSYSDLSNKPTIPAAPVQSDWSVTDNQSLAFIKNKPTIPAAQVQSSWTQSDTSAPDYIRAIHPLPTTSATSPTLACTLPRATLRANRMC